MVRFLFIAAMLVATFAKTISAFVPMQQPKQSLHIHRNIIDDLRLIYSDEGRKNRAAAKERRKREQEEAQREILERRRNPQKMQEYDQRQLQKRKELAEEKSVYDFQNKVEDGYDPLNEWKRLRSEGKVKVGSDLDRDEGSRRLGSEGLIDVRVDERMPYIDQGYVDEDSDVIGNVSLSF